MSLKINKETAIRLYNEVPEWFKEILETNFGNKFYKKFVYTDIGTYEDACRIEPPEKDDIIHPTDASYIIAEKKLKHIIKIINEGWIPDWKNANEYKHYPYFRVSASGFDFSYSDFRYSGAGASVGSRLCLQTPEKAKYMGEQFIKLYNDYLKY